MNLACRRLALGLLLCALAPACGYQVVRGDALFAATRIAVLPFTEQEPNGLSAPMAHSLSRRLAAGGVTVSGFGPRPAATLGGRVHVGNAPSATLRGVQTYAVTAEVHAALRSAEGAVVWQRDFALREEFLPTDPAQDIQPLVSEARRRTALVRLAERTAVAVHEAMVLDNFAQAHVEATL